MSTLDRNDLVVLQDTDAVAPFHPLINGVTESISQRFDNLTAPQVEAGVRPASPKVGQLIWDKGDLGLYLWNGTRWKPMNSPRRTGAQLDAIVAGQAEFGDTYFDTTKLEPRYWNGGSMVPSDSFAERVFVSSYPNGTSFGGDGNFFRIGSWALGSRPYGRMMETAINLIASSLPANQVYVFWPVLCTTEAQALSADITGQALLPRFYYNTKGYPDTGSYSIPYQYSGAYLSTNQEWYLKLVGQRTYGTGTAKLNVTIGEGTLLNVVLRPVNLHTQNQPAGWPK